MPVSSPPQREVCGGSCIQYGAVRCSSTDPSSLSELPKIFLGQRGDDRYYHFPDRCVQHHELGYGIYQIFPPLYPMAMLGISDNRYRNPPDHQCPPADRGNLYGYDTGLPDLHSDFPAGLSDIGYEYHSLWYYDDL